MDSKEVRKRYLEFFKENGHVQIDPAPLVLPDDPSTLFVSAGMQPLVPYLKGQKHPSGTRLVDSQLAIRTGDIEEVGDNRHVTLIEMLGNWSLGDYFKSEQLAWVFEFLTDKEKGLGLDHKRIYVSVFEGYGEVDKDYASIDIWKNIFETVGITALEATSPDGVWFNNGGRIFPYSAHKNWWSLGGTPDEMPPGEIGGPDSEIFFDFDPENKLKLHEKSQWKDEPCHPNCDCGRFIEIGNSVFIQYKKKEDGTLEELPQKSVDFGGGFERLVAATNDDPDVYKIDIFKKAIQGMETVINISYERNTKSIRIIADHLRAAVLLINAGIIPSNKTHGYVLRRLIRRATLNIKRVVGNLDNDIVFHTFIDEYIQYYSSLYIDYSPTKAFEIMDIVLSEKEKFAKTLDKGLKLLEKLEQPTGKEVFDLYQTYGFPLELTEELLQERGQKVDKNVFQAEFDKHKENSRTTSAGTFKGGLADSSEDVTKLHTATHLLQAALRHVLGDHVIQKGQNITGERSRFDFSHSEKLTDEQICKVEDLINEKIKENLPVKMEVLGLAEAEKTTAIHAFNEKYGDKVQIYYIGDDLTSAFSSEFCGGPHVTSTKMIGHVTIKKQEKVGAGVMRIYLVLE